VRWLHLLGKECVKDVDALCVAATLKLGGKKNIESFFGNLSTYKAFTWQITFASLCSRLNRAEVTS